VSLNGRLLIPVLCLLALDWLAKASGAFSLIAQWFKSNVKSCPALRPILISLGGSVVEVV